jgi:putative tryptophan/tyrosine transport system substrate-binding protein
VRRRDLLAGAAGAAAMPSMVAAQQAPARIRRIGALLTKAALTDARVAAFEEGLRALGWRPGETLKIEYRFVQADREQMRAAGKEMVTLAPELIVVQTTPMTRELRQMTAAIPMVFLHVSGPISDGIVASFAQPGGNITGFTDTEGSLGGKWLQLLKEIAPSLTRAQLMFNPQTAPNRGQPFLGPFKAVGVALGVETAAAEVHEVEDFERVFSALAGLGAGLAVQTDSFMGTRAGEIAALAARYAVPTVYPTRDYTERGGLASYGTHSPDLFRRAASYVDKILKGATPPELPVQAPTKYELVINLKTAKALGLTVPHSLLQRADEVIE